MVSRTLKELLLAYRRDRATLLYTYTTQVNLHPEAPNTANWNSIQTIRESIAFVEHNVRDLELVERTLASVPNEDLDLVNEEWENRFVHPLSAERLEEILFETITWCQEQQARRKSQQRIIEYEVGLQSDRRKGQLQRKTREQLRRKLEQQRRRAPLRTRVNQQAGRRVRDGGTSVKAERAGTPREIGPELRGLLSARISRPATLANSTAKRRRLKGP